MVKVATASGPLTEDVVAAHDLLLLTDASEADQLRWNAFCHAKGIKFIASGTLGAPACRCAGAGTCLTALCSQAARATSLWTTATRSQCGTRTGRTPSCAW